MKMSSPAIGAAFVRVLGAASAYSTLACDVDQRDLTTTGVNLEPAPRGGPRGFAVVSSDINYETYSVGLLDLDGNTVSPSLISSGSADIGLSSPFTDVVLPSSAVPGPELVIINRAPAAVLTWVDLSAASVRAQLDISSGFGSNPYDYVPIAEDKAYVTRYDANPASGAEPFDAGNDVLIIDPRVPAITGSIDMTPILAGEPAGFLPRAARALIAGGRVRVLALGFDETHTELLDARIVSIDPESDNITQVLVVEGMENCQTLALSPDGRELAAGCSGPFGADPALGFPTAGIVLFEVADDLREKRRLSAAELGGEAINSVTYASATSLAFTTFGRYDETFSAQAVPDMLRRYDLAASSLDPEALQSSALTPFNLNDIRCEPRSRVCLLTDAETDGGVLHRFQIAEDGVLEAMDNVVLERDIGLSPRSLGMY